MPPIITSDPNESVAAAVSVIAAPLLIVTIPVNVFVPVAEVIDNVPLVPPPTVVVPVTVKAKAPAVNVVPFAITRLLPIVVPTPRETEADPLSVTLYRFPEPDPLMEVVPLKVTVLVLGINVPSLTQLPLTVNVFEPVIVSVAPALIVMSLQRPPAAPIIG